MEKTGTPALASGKNTRRKHAHIAKIVLHLGLATLTAPMMVKATEAVTPTTEEAAKASSRNYSIAKQPLYSALSALAEQAGIQFVYRAEMVKNLNSPGVQGQYTAEEALQKVLSGTGISFRRTGPNTVALEKVPQQLNKADPTTLKVMTVIGTSAQDVNDPYNKSYAVTNSFTATKTDTPIMQTPVSIQVVPRAVMSDQKTTTIKDALENVSSVRPQSSLGLSNAFITRGFRNGRVFRNGLVANGLGIGEGAQFDSANLERVEVLKGPAAVLFGRIEPGGLINLVTKKPRDEAYYSVEQRFGSYDFYRTEWDATDAITKDKSLSYRFTGAYQNNKSFRDFNFNDRVLVNPSLTWRPGDATEMSLEVEALHEDYQVDRGLFAIGNRPAPIPVTRSFIDPNDPVDTNSKVNLGFNLTHAFNENWTLRNRFLASFVHDKNISVKPANGVYCRTVFRAEHRKSHLFAEYIFSNIRTMKPIRPIWI